MNRLTNHDRWHDDIDLTNEYGYKHIYNRLAEYENTGLMPDEIKAMQWISVKDRLPEECERVLIWEEYIGCNTSEKYEQVNVGYMYVSRTKKISWNTQGGINYKVTHWMPLPEPPKGELK